MTHTKKLLLPSLISCVMAGIAPQVLAQAGQATGENTAVLEEIVVTGLRRSLMDSIATKQDSTSIVEAISAEDIGKLPDVSIAESLARMPGLAAQRLNGRSQVISIRGLDPDFSSTLLNGRQQVSTGDNRSVEYDQYPSELLSAVTIYKTPDASLMGQGIAGTVNMQTISPLAHGERAVVVSGRYEWNDMAALNPDASNHGKRLNFSYIDQFADGTIGVALGFSHTDTPTQGERFNAWGYPDAFRHTGSNVLGENFDVINTNGSVDVLTDLGPDGVAGTEDDVFETVDGTPVGQVIGGAKPFVQSNTLTRNAVVGVVEFEPNDRFSSSVDFFYSDFEESQILRGIELPLGWGGLSIDLTQHPDFTVQDGLITEGTWTGVEGVIRSDAEIRDAELFAVGWNTRFNMTDEWRGEFDVSYSKADRLDQIVENYSGYVGATDTMGFITTDKGTRFNSSLDYTDASQLRIANLQGWGSDFVPSEDGGQKGYYKQPASVDELTQIRLNAERELAWGPISRIEFGVNYDTREKTKTTEPEYYFGLPGATPEERAEAPLPSDTEVTRLDFLGIAGMLGYDPLGPFNDGTYDLVLAVRSDIAAKTWTVNEDVTTGYVMLDLDSQVGSLPLVGNVGVQVVHTDQGSTAFSSQGIADTLVLVETEGGKTYTEVLPSLNLSLEVFDQTYVRLGMARTLSRARMDDLRASSEFSLSTEALRLDSTDLSLSPWSAGGGNPELDPWLADSFDLSFEQYFGNGLGYWSVAAFYKDLNSYIVSDQVLMDFSGYPTNGLEPQLNQGYRTVPINGEGGKVEGVEVSASLTGEMISEALAGFGLVASYSYTDSEIEPPTTPSSKLPGLSRDVYNLTFYYEHEGFSARISGRHRGEFLGELAGFDAQRTQRIVSGETIVDAQISYSFDRGALEGLTVMLQGNNLTDEPFITTDGNRMQVVDYQRYGATYALGMSYRF